MKHARIAYHLSPCAFALFVACSSAPEETAEQDGLMTGSRTALDRETADEASELGLSQDDVLQEANSFQPEYVVLGDACKFAASAGTIATASAAIMEISAGATATCAGVTAVTVAGELVCLVPAAGTALSGLTAAVAGVAAGTATVVCTGELAGVKIRKLAENLADSMSNYPIDCSPGDYLHRTAAKYYWCKLQGPSSCRSGMTCADLAARSAIANGCMIARLVQNACFPNNGDAGHKQQLKSAIANVNACNVAMASCR